jgi:hypothetical protein
MTTSPAADGLPQALGHAFETFEAIRQLARRCEDQSPDLFAAFISAATAAADGRDAILTASTLPASTPGPGIPAQLAVSADPRDIADSIATSAAILATCLSQAASLAGTSGDRRACQEGAALAKHIHDLLAPAR